MYHKLVTLSATINSLTNFASFIIRSVKPYILKGCTLLIYVDFSKQWNQNALFIIEMLDFINAFRLDMK